MEDKNLVIICITVIVCIGIMTAAIVFINQGNKINTSENDTINITLNDSKNQTNETTNTSTSTKSSNKNEKKSSSNKEYGDYIDDEWVSMSEEEYAERYPALYHEEALRKGKYDKYHPEFYEVDRENRRI